MPVPASFRFFASRLFAAKRGAPPPRTKNPPLVLPLVLSLGLSLGLAGCGNLTIEDDYPQTNSSAAEDGGSVFDLFRRDGKAADTKEATASQAAPAKTPRTAGLGVNSVLWQASLDTLSFMPLANADPIGGTIITDWYNDPGTPGDRLKVNVVISGMALRADAVRVAIFRERTVNGRTVSLAASSQAARQMENIILTRARDLATAQRR